MVEWVAGVDREGERVGGRNGGRGGEVSITGKLGASNAAHEKTILQRQLGTVEAEIDRIVFRLYGLGPSEIASVVESEELDNAANN